MSLYFICVCYIYSRLIQSDIGWFEFVFYLCLYYVPDTLNQILVELLVSLYSICVCYVFQTHVVRYWLIWVCILFVFVICSRHFKSDIGWVIGESVLYLCLLYVPDVLSYYLTFVCFMFQQQWPPPHILTRQKLSCNVQQTNHASQPAPTVPSHYPADSTTWYDVTATWHYAQTS